MKRRLLLSSALFLLLAACITAPVREGRPEHEDLREAVTKYWTYRVQNDLGNAYYYEHVSYIKLATREKYLGGFGGSRVIIKGFDILEIGGEGSGAEGYTPVKLKVKLSWPKATFPVPEVMENEIRDLWVKEKGQWYHILQQPTGMY